MLAVRVHAAGSHACALWSPSLEALLPEAQRGAAVHSADCRAPRWPRRHHAGRAHAGKNPAGGASHPVPGLEHRFSAPDSSSPPKRQVSGDTFSCHSWHGSCWPVLGRPGTPLPSGSAHRAPCTEARPGWGARPEPRVPAEGTDRRPPPRSSEQSAKADTHKELIKTLKELKVHLPADRRAKGKASTLATLKYALRSVKQVRGKSAHTFVPTRGRGFQVPAKYSSDCAGTCRSGPAQHRGVEEAREAAAGGSLSPLGVCT